MNSLPSPPQGISDEQPFPPDCAAKFAHVRRIASGGFGAVHQAIHRDLKRTVAIKLLLADLITDPQQVDRFDNEARITASIDHPNVIEVVDHGAAFQVPWIAYEYLPGRSLRAMLEAAPAGLPPAYCVNAVAQVVDALVAAHAKGVLHRDIKPDNVLGADSSRFKVTDFGIAKWSGKNAVRTRTGMVLGSPAYIAPELIEGAEATAASDIYAVGVMLYELLTGQLPFEGSAPLEIMERSLHGTYPTLASKREGLPPGLERIVARAMARNPADRYASAAELREALVDPAVLRNGGELRQVGRRGPEPRSGVVTDVVPALAEPPTRPRGGMAAAAIGALAVAALLVWRARAPEPAPLTSPAPSVARSAVDVPLVRKTSALEMRALVDGIATVAQAVAKLDDQRVGFEDYVINPAAGRAKAKPHLEAMVRHLHDLHATFASCRELELEEPASLLMGPFVFGLMDALGRTVRPVRDGRQGELLQETRLSVAMDRLREDLAAMRLGIWRDPLQKWAAPMADTLYRGAVTPDAGRLIEALTRAERALGELDRARASPSFAVLLARTHILRHKSFEIDGVLAPHATNRIDPRAIEPRQQLADATPGLLDPLAALGPEDGCGEDLVYGLVELRDALHAVSNNAYSLAIAGGTSVEEKARAMRLFLGPARAVGAWWWWEFEEQRYDLQELVRRSSRELANADPELGAELARLGADVETFAALDRLRNTQDFSPRALAADISDALALIAQPARAGRAPAVDLGIRVGALEAIDRVVSRALSSGGGNWIKDARLVEHQRQLDGAVASVVHALVSGAARPGGGTRFALAKVLRACLARWSERGDPRAPLAARDALHAWEAAAPCWETRWCEIAVPGKGGAGMRALAVGLLEDEYARLSRVRCDELATPERLAPFLSASGDLGNALAVAPDAALARVWLARYDEISGRFGLDRPALEWRATRQLLARAAAN